MEEEYEEILDNIETLIEDDTKYPVVEDSRMKLFFKMILEFIKFIMNYLLDNKDATTQKNKNT